MKPRPPVLIFTGVRRLGWRRWIAYCSCGFTSAWCPLPKRGARFVEAEHQASHQPGYRPWSE